MQIDDATQSRLSRLASYLASVSAPPAVLDAPRPYHTDCTSSVTRDAATARTRLSS